MSTSNLVALNADVVGYSRLLADDFDGTTETMGEFQRLVEEDIAGNGGTLVNFVGDNFMAVFEDPKDAIRSAISITTGIEARNADTPKARRVRFRMGLDQGGVSVSDGQYFGDALNIAARIQAIAPPGGMSVSGRVYRSLDEPALRFHPIGRKSLKNIPEEVDVYQFADLPTEGSAEAAHRLVSLSEPTVAVLPIHSESVEPSLRPIADLIREDIIHRLSRVPSLRVVNAVDEAGGNSVGPTVRYMLETGVHQVGEQVRVYAKLMDVNTMNIVTTNRWTASTDQLLALSDEVAEGVANSIEVELIVGEPAGLYAELEDPEAIQNIYMGWYHLTSGSPEGWMKAVEFFGRVAKSHPEKSYGHVLSAFSNWMGAAEGMVKDRDLYLNRAMEQAKVGLDLGDPTGLAQMVTAAVLMFQGQPEQALETIDKLEIKRPTCDVTYAVEGSVRRYLGDWEKSVDLLDKAMRLTAANKPWYPTVQACSLYLGGRVEQAAATAEAVLEYQPSNLEALLVLTAAQVEMGMDRRARATAELIKDRFPSVDVGEWLAKNPYQKREMVEKWVGDLATAGAIDS